MCCSKQQPVLKFILSDGAELPQYESTGAACADIKASSADYILPQGTAVISTGLKVEIPRGYVMLIYSRSGHGFKSDVRLANCVGVIDSDYRGEIKVKLTNDGNSIFNVAAGDRIAQFMLVSVPRFEFESAENLSLTDRGEGGFGSTGK